MRYVGARYQLKLFFSRRRRHTRCYRDWSSDVCSSDLASQREFPASQREFPASRREFLESQREFPEIGRASCRERVEIAWGGGYWKRKEPWGVICTCMLSSCGGRG